MKRIKLILVLSILFISSLFFIKKINSVFTKITAPNVNKVTINQDTSYTVVHEIMNLDATTYSEYTHIDYSNIKIGTTVTPNVLAIEGFDSPSTQTVTLDSYDNTVITYRYTRKQYTLTINNSNYVATSTPSGTYYYGQEIHLVAAASDNNGNPFTKWSNNVTNPDYTFTLTGNTTIEPVYSVPYTITYHPNNGDSSIIDFVVQNQSLGTLPSISYDDCVLDNGDYHARQCSAVYKFEGWYADSNFTTQVNEDYIPTGDMDIYAKWNKIYYEYNGTFTCDGTNYIDTDVKLFNELNADKDFTVSFTVDQNNGFVTSTGDRGSIFTDMNEVGEPYPGVHFFTNNSGVYTMNINTTGKKVKKNNTGYVTGQSVVIKKESGKIYYSYDNGTFTEINDFSNFNTYFNTSASFCAGVNAQGNRYRFFKGTISNMSIRIFENESYTIHFDSNGGTGMMLDQNIKLGQSTTINTNTYTNDEGTFAGWNTKADGTGTSYPDNYSITSNLGNDGDVITLYAQWNSNEHYYVHYEANDGTGTMTDQRFTIGNSAVALTQNSFTRTNYEFKGWNTMPDGSGTHYDDEQLVSDLSNVDEDVIILYAQWWKIQYNHPGDAVFDGTATTFINTGVNVFSTDNINKDFEIRFTFKSVDSDMLTVSPTQPTMFNIKDETNNKYPGINIRFNGTINSMNPTYRWGGSTTNVPSMGIQSSNAPISFIFKRTNGVHTMQFSYGTYTSQVYTMFDQNSWTLNQAFATNVAFGGYFDGSNQPGRFFKGTLSDMIILMDD